jgi:hypothetical protein
MRRICILKSSIKNQNEDNNMKKSIFLYFFLCSIHVVSAQKTVKYPLKFFSLRNARLSLGVGIEAPPQYIAEGLTSYYVLNEQANIEIKPETYLAGKVALDLFAPNSILNFYTEANYAYSSIVLKETKKNYTDTLSFGSLEVPLFIKIRMGSRESRDRYIVFFGGSLDLPLHVKRAWRTSKGLLQEDKTLDQLNRQGFNIGGGLGFEYFFTDHTRAIAYLRATYRENNLLNKNYPDFVANYGDADIKFLRLTVALSLFF